MKHGWLLIGLVGALASCSGSQRGGSGQSFQCRERAASYVAIKHIGGDELGVAMDCEEAGPRVKRWRTQQGQRIEDVHALAPGDFDRAWKEIDGTGWAFLKDCGNGSLEDHDPVYKFEVKDDQQKGSFKCQTREVPFPYFDITNSLDMLAQKSGKQLGDDEPPEAKALDKKDMQR